MSPSTSRTGNAACGPECISWVRGGCQQGRIQAASGDVLKARSTQWPAPRQVRTFRRACAGKKGHFPCHDAPPIPHVHF